MESTASGGVDCAALVVEGSIPGAEGGAGHQRQQRLVTSSDWPAELERRNCHGFFDQAFSGLPHRLSKLGLFTFTVVAVFAVQEFVLGVGRPPSSLLDEGVVLLSLTWLVALPSAVFGFAGLLLFEQRPVPDTSMHRIETLVSFRIVSRGQNVDALVGTVANVREVMRRAPLFPYRIEVVTDLPVKLDKGPDLMQLLVPTNYETPRRSKFKARALQFALEASNLPEKAWIMHLDEESHITPTLVAGIQEAVETEDRRPVPRIGQGAILYHRDIDRHPFLTLADSIRVGDDLSRFHLQHRTGFAIFGLHGSFILVRNDVERDVGFDFGPQGSITEDAFWAIVQMERGRRSRWVTGYVVEQSTRSVSDFVKQRRRWFVGLVLVVRHAPVTLRFRLGLLVAVVTWSLSWVALLVVAANMALGISLPPVVRLAGNLTFAHYLVLYVMGLRVTMHHDPDMKGLRKVAHYVAQVGLMPVFALMEATGVVYGLVRPDVANFHVVKK